MRGCLSTWAAAPIFTQQLDTGSDTSMLIFIRNLLGVKADQAVQAGVEALVR